MVKDTSILGEGCKKPAPINEGKKKSQDDRKVLQNIKFYLRMTFKRREYTQMDNLIIFGLQTRASVCKFTFSIVRMYLLIFQKGAWFGFQDPKLCSEHTNHQDSDMDCVVNYNKDLMDPGMLIFRVILVALLVIAFIISILSFQWRHLANLFVYIECGMIMVAALIPNGFNSNQDLMKYLWTHVIIIVCLYTGKVAQIIITTISLVYHYFFI